MITNQHFNFKHTAYRWLSGGTSGCHAGGREFDSDRSNTQGLKTTEKVLQQENGNFSIKKKVEKTGYVTRAQT